MIRHSPLQQVREARRIAEDHGCRVSERGGKYRVYRVTTGAPVYLGARSSPAGLRAFICRVTGFH